MNREKDYPNFIGLMAMIGECTPQGQPTSEKIEMYFMALEDLSFEYIKETAKRHLMTNKWFPAICELRNESDEALELQAQKDYALLEHLTEAFLYPGFAEVGMNIITQKLTEKKREELIPVAKRWCAEIGCGSNPSATRAQCLKSIASEIKIQNITKISGKSNLQIEEAKNLLKDIG